MISWDVVSIGFYVAFMVTSLPVGYLFYHNREIHPIKGRFPEYVYVLYLFRLFISFVAELPFLIDDSEAVCFIQAVFWFYIAAGAFWVYNYRMMRLLFAYSITENIAQLEDQASIHTWRENWYTKNRRLTKPGLFKRISLALSVVYFTCVILAMAADTANRCSASGTRLYSICLIAVCMLQAVLTVFLSCKLSKYKSDAFFIKNEIRFTLTVMVISLGLLGIVYIASSKESGSAAGPLSVVSTCNGWAMFAPMIAYPVYQSHKEKALIAARGEVSLKKLDEFVAIPEGFEAFLEYLKTEFSAENLYFYWEVRTYKQQSLNNAEILKEKALAIFHRFLGNTAVCQVNLPSGTADQVYEKIGEIPNQGPAEDKDLHCFASAEKEIYDLMCADSFFRFERTPEYQAVKKRILKDMSTGYTHNKDKPGTVGSKGSKSLRDLADRLAEGEGDLELKRLRLQDDPSSRNSQQHLLTPKAKRRGSQPTTPKGEGSSPALSARSGSPGNEDDKTRDLDTSGHSSPSISAISNSTESPNHRKCGGGVDADIPPIIIEENQQLLDADVDDDDELTTPSRLDSPSHHLAPETPNFKLSTSTPKETVFGVV